jgi:hypothetical protein
MIAALYNIPSDRITLQRYGFHNRDSHDLASDAVFKLTGIAPPRYLLDPIPINDFKSWAYTHQAAHNSINAALGLPGNDLTDVDPTKPEQLASWVQLHAFEHVQWGIFLGIG